MPNELSDTVRIFSPPVGRNELIDHLRRGISELARVLPVRRATLFGSWAKGRATAFSDIDVLIVYADPPREGAYQLVWRSLRQRGLEPHVYSESEADALQTTLDRMTREGIDLMPAGPEA